MNADAKELAANFDLEKLTAEFYDNPYPTYRALRENEPVKRLPNGTVFLTRYDDLVTTYKNTKSFNSDKKREFAPKYGDTPLYEHHPEFECLYRGVHSRQRRCAGSVHNVIETVQIEPVSDPPRSYVWQQPGKRRRLSPSRSTVSWVGWAVRSRKFWPSATR